MTSLDVSAPFWYPSDSRDQLEVPTGTLLTVEES